MSARNLRYMQKFASEYRNDEFLQGVLAKISWNHNQILLDKVKNKEKRIWHAEQSIENGWSVSLLSHQIELKLYERQALLENKTNNFNETLPKPRNEQVKELLKSPYIFDFITNDIKASELDIEKELTNNTTKLLLELGNGFSFVGRQYHLEIDDERLLYRFIVL